MYCWWIGIENRFPLTTGSNWLNPSTSIAFMLNNSLTNALFLHALQNNYVALASSSQWENANTGVEGAIVAELESLRRQRCLECGLISQINDANSATCTSCSTVISCWNICRHAALNIRSALVAFLIFNAVHWYYWMPWAVLFTIACLPLKHFLFTYIASNWTVSVRDCH